MARRHHQQVSIFLELVTSYLAIITLYQAPGHPVYEKQYWGLDNESVSKVFAGQARGLDCRSAAPM